jgi:hypothetical protein
MKKFLKKLAIFCIPFAVALLSFIFFDPFRIVRGYDDFSKNMSVIPNRDFVSTETYLKNREKHRYDSFIFGSSRTVAFKTHAWANYLPPGSRPFMFDASGESVYGIYKKIAFVDSLGETIRNCLVILCTDTSFARDSDQDGHLFVKHPRVAGTSWIHFYLEFLKSYLDPKFLFSYYKFMITQKYEPSMRRFITTAQIKYDGVTNDIYLIDVDNELRRDEVGYYRSRANVFFDRKPTVGEAEPLITDKLIAMLQEIMDIFKRHGTDYKIIISPLYDQIQLNPADLDRLKRIFGESRVFDYSGKNRITESIENYYEDKHYRPEVGILILQEIYGSTAIDARSAAIIAPAVR